MMTEQLKVTSPEEYAKKAQEANASESKGFLHKLKKTGAVVRLRHADMEALAVMGELPMSLVAAASRVEADTAKKKSNKKPTSAEIEEGLKTAIFMRQMVVENCLEPRIQHQEGVGVFFVGKDGKPVARVNKYDFYEMFAVISGEEGNDGLEPFRNRKERRASAAKSGGKRLQSEPVATTEEQPA